MSDSANRGVVDFEALAALLGDELTPEFIDWFGSAKFPQDRVYGVAEHLAQAFGSGGAVHVSRGEVVPHLPMSPNPPAGGHPGGVNLYPRSFFNEPDLSRADEALRRHFLYCHRIVMDNPALVIFSMARHPSMQGPGADARTQRALTAFLTFLMEWRPAIEESLLQFVDPRYKFESSDLLDTYAAAQGLAEFQPPSTPLDDAIFDLVETMQLAEEMQANVSLYLPNDLYVQGLRQIATTAAEKVTAELSEPANFILRQLLQAEVPKTSELTTNDIVRIRRDSDVFEDWRGSLRAAVLESRSLADGTVDPQRAFENTLTEELQRSSRALRRTARASKAMGPSAEQLTRLAIGGVSPAGVLKVSGIKVVSRLPRALLGYIARFRFGAEGDPILAHYLAFNDEP